MYGGEIDVIDLKTEANILWAILTGNEVNSSKGMVWKYRQKFSRKMKSNLLHVVRLLLVYPERSFSMARHLKRWLQATMKSNRINLLALFNMHTWSLGTNLLQKVTDDSNTLKFL